LVSTRRWAVAGVAAVVVTSVVGTGVTTSAFRAGSSQDRREDQREAVTTAKRPRTIAAATAPRTTAARTAATAPACPWLDDHLPVGMRVDELIAAMTPAEEASLLHLHQVSLVVPYEGYSLPIPRLCVPLITEQDGAAGVANEMTGVTQLPAPIADAAAFDPSLAQRYGDVIGAEDAAKGVDLALAPTINIDRSPYWGRSYETLGEDPYLTASLAVPLVRGIQADRVVSVVKHFAVYNQETHRSTPQDDSIVSDTALHEVYLPAFSAATQAGQAGAVMCSYNLINGTPACEDGPLIQGILHDQWHFSGFVRSDCNSVYQQGPAVAVGVSQVKCSRLYNPASLGVLPKATLDSLIRPLLTVLFSHDLIADPHPLNHAATVTTPAHAAVALQTANEGAVLLRNQRGLLPLDFARLHSLALVGAAYGTPMPAGFGAIYVQPDHPVSALEAFRAALGGRVHYASGSDLIAAAGLARASDAAVVVVNDIESEHIDRTTLALTPHEDALIGAVAAANPRTIVVLETGSAVLMPWLRQVGAVLETWYPGQAAGTSLVELVSGQVDPSGKLPVTFPADAALMPAGTAGTFGGVDGRTVYAEGVDVGYRWYDANGVMPAFPFGFGLSYTKFGFSHLQLKTNPSGGVSVDATVTNAGRVAGADVVQCYVAPPSAGEPPRQLRGFTRVDLLPGQSQAVHLVVSPGDLAAWDSAHSTWTVTGGTYHFFVGDASDLAHLPLRGQVHVAPTSLGADSGPAPAS
jgi:beta-glucosidase